MLLCVCVSVWRLATMTYNNSPKHHAVFSLSRKVKYDIWHWYLLKIFSSQCSLTTQNQDKKPNQGSLEDLSQDQPDQALLLSEPINIQRRSPMIRNRKTGSMEVPHLLTITETCTGWLPFLFYYFSVNILFLTVNDDITIESTPRKLLHTNKSILLGVKFDILTEYVM